MTLSAEISEAARWNIKVVLVKSFFSVCQILIIARVFEIDDVVRAAILISFINVYYSISNFGIPSALIHFQEISNEGRSTLYYANLVLLLTLSIAMISTASIFEQFFRVSGIEGALTIISPVVIFMGVAQFYRAEAEKDFRFRPVSKAEILSQTISFFIFAAFAEAGFGSLSVILWIWILSILNTFLFLAIVRSDDRSFRYFSISMLLHFAPYCMRVFISNLVSSFTLQSDLWIAGRWLDPAILALYSQPRDFCLKVIFAINPIITRATFPYFSRNKYNIKILHDSYLSGLRVILGVSFPIFISAAFAANALLTGVFGGRWADFSIPFVWICLWCCVRSIGNPLGAFLFATGREKIAFRWSLFVFGLQVISCIIAVQFGIVTYIQSLFFVTVFIIMISWRIILCPILAVTFFEFSRVIVKPLFCSVVANIFVNYLISSANNSLLATLLSACCVVAAYIILSFMVNKEFIGDLRRVLRSSVDGVDAKILP